jgi:cation diffusion facilitator CzcD-associated flavoprotein CzcO
MIVGASASGVQLAQEIRTSGREVILCVGEHVRPPRLYRGRDILWWMDALGLMDTGYIPRSKISVGPGAFPRRSSSEPPNGRASI